MRAPAMIDTESTETMLWQRILSEAEQPAGSENVLAPIIADCVTSRANLADAICSRIADLLAPPLATAPLLSALRLLVTQNAGILSAASEDIAAAIERDPATTKALHVLLHAKEGLSRDSGPSLLERPLEGQPSRTCAPSPGVCIAYPPSRHTSCCATRGGHLLRSCDRHWIGETTIIDNNVSILQNVTLGGTGKEQGQRHPKVRHGVLIGAGATILGNIEVGANARVGAGSVVLKPVAPGTIVAGVPARVLRKHGSAEPSRAMDQLFETGQSPDDIGSQSPTVSSGHPQ